MKRRSSGKNQPEPLTFFIDQCLGKKDVAQAMRDAGHFVELHDDHFKQDEQDHSWLPQVGAKGWFILTSMKLPGREMAEAFTKGLRKIERLVEKEARPFVATVTRRGDVQLVKYSLADENQADS